MSTVILGVDPRKQAEAAVMLVGEHFQVYTYVMPKSLVACCDHGRRWMEALCVRIRARYPGRELHVYIERVFTARNPRTAIEMAYVQGGIIAGAVSGGANLVTQVSPSDWKQTLMGKGKGNVGKPEIRAFARQNWKRLHDAAGDNQDVIDAGLIAWYGQQKSSVR